MVARCPEFFCVVQNLVVMSSKQRLAFLDIMLPEKVKLVLPFVALLILFLYSSKQYCCIF